MDKFTWFDPPTLPLFAPISFSVSASFFFSYQLNLLFFLCYDDRHFRSIAFRHCTTFFLLSSHCRCHIADISFSSKPACTPTAEKKSGQPWLGPTSTRFYFSLSSLLSSLSFLMHVAGRMQLQYTYPSFSARFHVPVIRPLSLPSFCPDFSSRKRDFDPTKLAALRKNRIRCKQKESERERRGREGGKERR